MEHAADFAEEADPVRHVVVRQRAQNDVDRLALDPRQRVIKRVDAKPGTVANTSSGALDHRRRGIAADYFRVPGEQLFDVEARAARRIEHALAVDVSEEPQRRRTVVQGVVRGGRGVLLVLSREGVVLGWIRRWHRKQDDTPEPSLRSQRAVHSDLGGLVSGVVGGPEAGPLVELDRSRVESPH